jgi:hypothetical protein
MAMSAWDVITYFMPPPPPPPVELTLSAVSGALLSGEGYGTHVRTAAYFATFLGCLATVGASFPWRAAWQRQPSLLLCWLYAAVALVSTWRLILRFFVAHTTAHAAHADPPNLFVEAYALVADEPHGWVWSSSLLLWVTVACPMVHAEAARRGMPARLALCYVAVAFLGAVSLAFPPLLAHLSLLPPSPGGRSPPRRRARLWGACAAASLLSVLALPVGVHASRSVFIGALLVVHLVLVAPLVAWAADSGSGAGVGRHARSSSVRGVTVFGPSEFGVLTWLTAVLHLHALATALLSNRTVARGGAIAFMRSFGEALLLATTRNDCQASISIDSVLAGLIGIAYMLTTSPTGVRRTDAIRCSMLSAFIGPASALALFTARHLVADGQPLARQAVDKTEASSRRPSSRTRRRPA